VLREDNAELKDAIESLRAEMPLEDKEKAEEAEKETEQKGGLNYLIQKLQVLRMSVGDRYQVYKQPTISHLAFVCSFTKL
jgi:septal ring factor EnvC (AmiA/AmiB activator)